MADDPDTALTVALAEYEHLREARQANNDQSIARFNFFLVVASAATAVAGGLITGGGSGVANTSAVIGIGALVLLLGLTVFVRQVEFTNRAHLYGVAIDSVRTYLTRRAPDVAPYLIMPTLDDHIGYVRRRTSVAAARIRAMVDQRHPSGGPVPAPRPAETSPI
jgi:hypothetical protein